MAEGATKNILINAIFAQNKQHYKAKALDKTQQTPTPYGHTAAQHRRSQVTGSAGRHFSFTGRLATLNQASNKLQQTKKHSSRTANKSTNSSKHATG